MHHYVDAPLHYDYHEEQGQIIWFVSREFPVLCHVSIHSRCPYAVQAWILQVRREEQRDVFFRDTTQHKLNWMWDELLNKAPPCELHRNITTRNYEIKLNIGIILDMIPREDGERRKIIWCFNQLTTATVWLNSGKERANQFLFWERVHQQTGQQQFNMEEVKSHHYSQVVC